MLFRSSVIDTQTLAVVDNIPVGQRPWNMGFSADGRKLYVACGRSASVHVIDVQTRQVITEIAVGKLPWGVGAH